MRSILTLFNLGFRQASYSQKIFFERAFSTSTIIMNPERFYTFKHEWISVKDDIGTVGISHFAQEALGDVVYVETPEVGAKYSKGETVGTIESVKAASDVYSPVSGIIVEKNEQLDKSPFYINKSTYEKGWLYKIKFDDETELHDLLNESEYENYCKEQSSDE